MRLTFLPQKRKMVVKLQMSESIFDFLEVLRYAPVNPRVIWMRWGVVSLFVSFAVSLLYCIVWVDVSISAMWLIFREIYNLSSVGPDCASVISGAMRTFQRRLAPLPLCPWACPWSTPVFCDQRGYSSYLATSPPLFSQLGKRPGCSFWQWKET